MRKLQIGVIGSCSDLNYSKAAEDFAKKLGELIAKSGYALVFGAEKDINSLPTIAAVEAKRNGGMTIGITYEKGLSIFNEESASFVIATGLVRGGGRETTLMLSCDAVIAISGGSGTLNEMCVAYQANIPVIVAGGFGGWSDKLADECLDDRNRYRFFSGNSAEQVLDIVTTILQRRPQNA